MRKSNTENDLDDNSNKMGQKRFYKKQATARVELKLKHSKGIRKKKFSFL